MDAFSPAPSPINEIIALLILHVRDIIEDLEFMYGELESGYIPSFPTSPIIFKTIDALEEID